MNYRPFRTLFLWAVWAFLALATYVFLYRGAGVWAYIQSDPSKITWLIIGLFIFGLVGSFALIVRLTSEAQHGSQLDIFAREGGLKAIKISSTKRAVDRFFLSLQSTLSNKGQPDVEALLHIELASFERMSHSTEVTGNILITLGLIGTVMGLTLTLTGLTSSLEALGHDQELLILGLRQAMSGMGAAFYTTLLGAILGGVLLRKFAQITQHGVESLHDNLLRTCLVYCSADYIQTTEREVRHLNQEVRILEENITNLQQVFASSQSVVAQFRDEITRLGDKTDDGEPLPVLLSRHKAYCEMLRQEMHMLAHMDRPWYIKLRELFRSQKKR